MWLPWCSDGLITPKIHQYVGAALISTVLLLLFLFSNWSHLYLISCCLFFPLFSIYILLTLILLRCSNQFCFLALFLCVILLSHCSSSLAKAITVIICVCAHAYVCVLERRGLCSEVMVCEITDITEGGGGGGISTILWPLIDRDTIHVPHSFSPLSPLLSVWLSLLLAFFPPPSSSSSSLSSPHSLLLPYSSPSNNRGVPKSVTIPVANSMCCAVNTKMYYLLVISFIFHTHFPYFVSPLLCVSFYTYPFAVWLSSSFGYSSFLCISVVKSQCWTGLQCLQKQTKWKVKDRMGWNWKQWGRRAVKKKTTSRKRKNSWKASNTNRVTRQM